MKADRMNASWLSLTECGCSSCRWGSHTCRCELFPAMGGLLSRLALHDAANVIRSHVLPWLERRLRREQAAAMITKHTLSWLYKPGGPMMRRCAQEFCREI